MSGILMKHECKANVCAWVSTVHPLLMNGGIHTNQIKDGVENLIKVQQSLHLIKSPFDAWLTFSSMYSIGHMHSLV